MAQVSSYDAKLLDYQLVSGQEPRSDPSNPRHRGGNELSAGLGVENVLQLVVLLPEPPGDAVVLGLGQLPHAQVGGELRVAEHQAPGSHYTAVLACKQKQSNSVLISIKGFFTQ